MQNIILKRINSKGWRMIFSTQSLEKGYFFFKRINNPQFSVSVVGDDESRVYGDAEVEIAWIERFIEENELENKIEMFIKNKHRLLKNKLLKK